MKALLGSLALVVTLLVALIAFKLCTYTVGENDIVIVTQFGRPIGQPITAAGLHFKLPFVQQINRMDSRIHEWSGQAVAMPTRDKLYIIVDSYARWRISDPLLWFTRLRDERSALSRMDDIIGSENRNEVANNDLIEIVRTDKNRKPVIDPSQGDTEPGETNASPLPSIKIGRSTIEKDVTQAATDKLKEFGIQLIDVRFRRINYSPSVTDQINSRMISERKQIANRYRAEGEGEAAKILGNKERDLQTIQSAAYKQVQEIRGEADAKAAEIYAQAYNQSKDAAGFYSFLKTLETYTAIATNDTTMVLSTDSALFRYLNSINPAPAKPVAAQAMAR
jgi:modulator of FtsH protease HflC